MPSDRNIRRVLFWLCLGLGGMPPHAADLPPLADEAQIEEALASFKSWTQFYQQENYREQHKLVHPLIRKYKKRKAWQEAMRRGVRKSGSLLDYEITAYAATTADKIPCTEMGHCYRQDIQVVLIVMNSRYERIGEKEKEYVVMANSEKGWMFGGGTFLNRPFGETMTILDRTDEKRYAYKGVKINH